MLKEVNYMGENRKAVIGSAVIAKAALLGTDRKCKIVVVFQSSTRQEFYWVFHARSPRAPRRSWKLASYHPRDFAFDTKPYWDFGSFVEYYAGMFCLSVQSQKVMHKKRLSSLLNKTEHESIMGNWTLQDPKRIVTDRCRERAMNARSRRWAW